MHCPRLTAALLIGLLCSPALGQDDPPAVVAKPLEVPSVAHSWRADGWLGPLRGLVVVRPDGEGLVLTTEKGLILRGPARPNEEGFFVFREVERHSVGAAGRLQGQQSEAETGFEVRLRENVGDGSFAGAAYEDGELVSEARLVRRRRALVGYSNVRTWIEDLWLQTYSAQTALYYRQQRYRVVREQLDNYEELIELLEEAARENDPFERVVIIAHSGQIDGPVLGYGGHDSTVKGTRQVSPTDFRGKALFPALTAAVKNGTTADAVIFGAGCNTGDAWVGAIAAATGRTVAGPTEYTSWKLTRHHVQAIEEGRGAFAQDFLWAQGDQLHEIPAESGIRALPEEARPARDRPLGEDEELYPTWTKRRLMPWIEGLRSEAVMDQIAKWKPYIDAVATSRHEADLMRAIVFEEQIHQNPPGFEAPLERAGVGQTVGPSQMHVALWAKKYGTSREALLEPKSHFPVMQKHLAYMTRLAEERSMGYTAEAIGTLWNRHKATSVTPYGRRVARYYEFFAERR